MKHEGLRRWNWKKKEIKIWHYRKQKGLCAFCHEQFYYTPLDIRNLNKEAVLDHDHATKQPRGLVHRFCNIHYIGTHTLETAKRLVSYLERVYKPD